MQEINFDQLLGEANQNEADFVEDREDDEVTDEDDSLGEDNLGDSLAFSRTNDLQDLEAPEIACNLSAPQQSSSFHAQELEAPPSEELAAPEDNTLNSQTENAMWDMVISKHGKKEFDTCYHIIGKFKSDRFSETAQK